jgi:hypothetical protein
LVAVLDHDFHGSSLLTPAVDSAKAALRRRIREKAARANERALLIPRDRLSSALKKQRALRPSIYQLQKRRVKRSRRPEEFFFDARRAPVFGLARDGAGNSAYATRLG